MLKQDQERLKIEFHKRFLTERERRKKLYHRPQPEPRFDEVYWQGVEALAEKPLICYECPYFDEHPEAVYCHHLDRALSRQRVEGFKLELDCPYYCGEKK